MGEVHAGGGPRGLRLGSRLFAAVALALGLSGVVAPAPAAAAVDPPKQARAVAPQADQLCAEPGLNQVVLFADPGQSGACVMLGVGEYGWAGVDFWPVGDDDVESVKVGGRVSLTLCSDAYLGGDCLVISRDEPGLAGAANSTSSARIAPVACEPAAGEVTLFADVEFTGACATLGAGEYDDGTFQFGTVGNDNAQSVRVGSGAAVTLCLDGELGAPCATAASDVADLSATAVGSNTASSAKVFLIGCVPASNEVAVYAGVNFSGICATFPPGYQDFDETLGNDNAESVKVGKGATVALCPDYDPGMGTCAPIASDVADLASTIVGRNAASSLEVSPLPCVPAASEAALYAEVNYGGACVTLAAGAYVEDAADGEFGAVGDDNAASVKVGSGVTIAMWPETMFGGAGTFIVTDVPDLASMPIGRDTASSAVVQVRPDETPPVATWVGPAYGSTITGPTVRLDASLADSGGTELDLVEFYATWADGWEKLAAIPVSGAAAVVGLDSWDMCASGAPDGTIRLRTVVFDAGGNSGTYSNLYIAKSYDCAATTLSVSAVTSWVAGSAHSVTVTAKDSHGNTATGYRGTVHFTSTDPKAVLPVDYKFTAADRGVHRFAVAATLKTAGLQAIRARDTVTGTITGLQTRITVTPAGAATVAVASVSSWVAGSAQSLTVTAKDAYGNTATGYRGTVHFTSTDPKAALPGDYKFAAADNGVHVFPGAILKTAGSQAIRARDTATGTITGLRTGIAVAPAAAATLVVSGFPDPTVAGAAHPLSVTARDAYGNAATGYRGTIRFTSTDPKAMLPGNYTFTSGDGGRHVFQGVILKTAGLQAIRARDAVTATITGLQSGIAVQ